MSGIKHRRRNVRQKKRMRAYKGSVLAVGAVLLLLVVVVSVNAISLKAKAESYEAQKIELEQQIEDEKVRSEEIDDLEEYVGTDEYVEDVAKEKLGLVHKNEIIFKAE